MSLSRRDYILKLIVEYFIKNAQPVGSHTLIEEYHLDVSSATIRNEMFALEKEGYLEKTHTSSGRVPSSKGYRYYIDHLRNESVDTRIKNEIANLLSERTLTVEQAITQSCEILSHMTNLASVMLGPNAKDEHLISVQLIPISTKTATVVFVTDKGYVENKTFVFDEDTEIKDIESCVKVLNDRLKGTAVSQLIDKMDAIRPVLQNYVSDNDMIYQVFMEAFLKFARDRISLFGKGQLFNQEDIASDADKLRRVLNLFDSPDEMRRMLITDGSEDISISINDNDVSIITSKIKMPGQDDGTIALVGPKRMDYEKVVGALEYVAQELEKYFARERNKNGRK
ncbi:MAG: heat-inducible transcription repressor HrcA [Erysipelotrichales bacterium]|nr:heat-inducible transcription repressor HrcA [Erysipelotrichales bacterium]